MTLKNTLLTTVALLGVTAFATAQEPYRAAEDSWISLTGDVAWTGEGTFTLDYGKGLITVEMDDWDWYDEANRILPGERVTVYGRIDDGLYELRTVEAESVYVADRNTFFYADAADEEGDDAFYPFYFGYNPHLPEGSWMTVSGEVTKIDGREFTLDTGFRKVRVDTDEMLYNPMDDVGFQKVKKGHRVSVTGTLDVNFFEKNEIDAESILSLNPSRKSKMEKRSEKKKMES